MIRHYDAILQNVRKSRVGRKKKKTAKKMSVVNKCIGLSIYFRFLFLFCFLGLLFFLVLKDKKK